MNSDLSLKPMNFPGGSSLLKQTRFVLLAEFMKKT